MNAPLKRMVIGRSVEGRPIVAQVTTWPAHRTLVVFAGFHGDEPKGVYVVERLIEQLRCSIAQPASAPASRKAIRWVLVPVVNPDGYARRRRRNARGVDINRNFPTSNWILGSPRSRMFGGYNPESEPETRAVIRTIIRYRPQAIVTLHSISGGRHCNNFDGPARRIARRLSTFNGYPVTSSIGYPTPGSFGSWAGTHLGIPTITLELPSNHSPKQCWLDNTKAFIKGLG